MTTKTWSEIAPNLYESFSADGTRQTHLCGSVCREPTEHIQGIEYCPISRVRIGYVISTEEDGEAIAAQRRRNMLLDPLNLDGQLAQQRTTADTYAKLFRDALVVDDPARYLAEEIKKRRLEGLTRDEAGQVIRDLGSKLLPRKELEDTTVIAIKVARAAPDADYQALLCGILYRRANEGLVYKGVEVIPPSAKIGQLMPPVRSFPKYGLEPALVGIGTNAIAKVLEVLVKQDERKAGLKRWQPLALDRLVLHSSSY